jgi:hypothetical protein
LGWEVVYIGEYPTPTNPAQKVLKSRSLIQVKPNYWVVRKRSPQHSIQRQPQVAGGITPNLLTTQIKKAKIA